MKRRGPLSGSLVEDGISWWMSVPVAIVFQTGLLIRTFSKSSPPPLSVVAAYFQYTGWLTTKGGIPYYHFSDVKAPLSFFTTGLLAHVASGDVLILHVLSVLLSCTALIAIVYAISKLVYEITEYHEGAVAAGLGVYILPSFYNLATHGFDIEPISIAFGLLGVVFIWVKDRPVLAGILGAVSAGYWQYSIIFPLLIIFIARTDKRRMKRVLGGMAGTTALTLAPFLVWGNLYTVIETTVIGPVFYGWGTGGIPLHKRPVELMLILGYGTPVVLLGIFGNLFEAWNDKSVSWIGIASLYAIFEITVISFQNFSDLLLLYIFSLVGVGIAARKIQSYGENKSGIASNTIHMTPIFIIGTIIVLNVFWFGAVAGVSIGGGTVPPSQEQIREGLTSQSPDSSADSVTKRTKSRRDIYWNKYMPDSCDSANAMTPGYRRKLNITIPGCSDYPL